MSSQCLFIFKLTPSDCLFMSSQCLLILKFIPNCLFLLPKVIQNTLVIRLGRRGRGRMPFPTDKTPRIHISRLFLYVSYGIAPAVALLNSVAGLESKIQDRVWLQIAPKAFSRRKKNAIRETWPRAEGRQLQIMES